MMKKLISVFIGAALLLGTSVNSLSSAHAATEDTPPDVQAAYSVDALEALRGSEETLVTVDKTGVPDFSGAAAFGRPLQVHLWSIDLISGTSSATPTTAIEEWLAPVLGSRGEPLGTYRVWRPTPGGDAELAGYNDSVELASALLKVDEDSILVSDPAIEAWYTLDRGTVSALNQAATREVPYPTSITDFAKLVSARYAESIKNAEEVGDGAAGGMTLSDQRPWYYGMDPWILSAGAALLLTSSVAMIWCLGARRTPEA